MGHRQHRERGDLSPAARHPRGGGAGERARGLDHAEGRRLLGHRDGLGAGRTSGDATARAMAQAHRRPAHAARTARGGRPPAGRRDPFHLRDLRGPGREGQRPPPRPPVAGWARHARPRLLPQQGRHHGAHPPRVRQAPRGHVRAAGRGFGHVARVGGHRAQARDRVRAALAHARAAPRPVGQLPQDVAGRTRPPHPDDRLGGAVRDDGPPRAGHRHRGAAGVLHADRFVPVRGTALRVADLSALDARQHARTDAVAGVRGAGLPFLRTRDVGHARDAAALEAHAGCE